MSDTLSLEPIVKTLKLGVGVTRAFHHFTDNIHIWWPMKQHSLSQENAETVVFEAKPGGRIYEIEKSGKEREWGRVLACEAPCRLVFSWLLEAPEKATEIEVLFAEEGEGASSLKLIHRGWETRPDGAEWRVSYNTGWDGVLGSYSSTLS